MAQNHIQTWKDTGKFILCGPSQHSVFVKQMGNTNAPSEKTLLLHHGFPESSYSYHKILENMLSIFDSIILFDMIGYGLSDKPLEGFAYSLFEQADIAYAVWHHFGITGGHLLAHDMGDSVATELLTRHENKINPIWFADGLQSVTFTNGGMVLELAQLRITQKLLLSKYGYRLRNLLSYKVFVQQVNSAHGNSNLSENDIQTLWAFNKLQEGQQKTYLTIKYLDDRKKFEKTRWLPALAQSKLPIHICWGDADRVARVSIAYYLNEKICTNAHLTIMKGLGHFCQLGNPEQWLVHVGNFYRKIL